MAETTVPSMEDILRLCATAAPNPWYPSEYVRSTGIPRDNLDLPLERLRVGGLIRLTVWVKGTGQGYVLTPEGEEALQSPRSAGPAAPARCRAASPSRCRSRATPMPPTIATIDEVMLGSGRPRAAYSAVVGQHPRLRVRLPPGQPGGLPANKYTGGSGTTIPEQFVLNEILHACGACGAWTSFRANGGGC